MGNGHRSNQMHPLNIWASPGRDVKNSWREEHQRVFKQVYIFFFEKQLLGDLCLWKLWDGVFLLFYFLPPHIKKLNLVGGFNPFEKYESKWESSPNRDEHKKIFELPPPRNPLPCYLSASWSLKIGSPSRAVLDVFARNTCRPRCADSGFRWKW